jgi:16S rRNA (guanine966-N2)-methyltransferase
VRETLFNWLSAHIAGARVLDLFAGTGALGLEAASRGAGEVTLVESQRAAQAALRETLQRLALPKVNLVATDALQFLESGAGQYEVIFLDPPFASGLLAPALAAIQRRGRLTPGGFCYVEQARESPPPELPTGPCRSGQAGGSVIICFMYRSAIYPGTLTRSPTATRTLCAGAGIFERARGRVQSGKTPMFTLEERVDLARRVLGHPQCGGHGCGGLTVDSRAGGPQRDCAACAPCPTSSSSSSSPR